MALRYVGYYNEALIYAELGCKVDLDNRWTMFELYDRMGRIKFGQVEDSNPREKDEIVLQGALEDLEKAIKYSDDCPEDKDQEKVERTVQLKLRIEVYLNRHAGDGKRIDIICQFQQHREVIFFDDIVRDLGEQVDWDNLYELLKRVPDTQLADGCRKETHKFIQYSASQCSKKKDTGPLKRIETLYDKAIETLEKQQNGQLLGSTLLWRATIWKFYRDSNGEKGWREKRVQDLISVLDSKSSASFMTKTFASWQLMDNYFEDFRQPLRNEDVKGYLSRKEKAQGSMEQVIKWFSGIQDPDFEVSLSPLSIPVAIIYKDTKQWKKFFEELSKTFDSCYEALTDNVIYNDKPSYLMLAKIPALLGLDEQAKAAFKTWCKLGSNLNADDGGQRAKKDRNSSSKGMTREEMQAKEFSEINVECNGPCGKMIENLNDTPVYLCYYCINTILCHNCRALIDAEDNIGLCSKGHCYIEASKDTPELLKMDELKEVWDKKWEEYFRSL